MKWHHCGRKKLQTCPVVIRHTMYLLMLLERKKRNLNNLSINFLRTSTKLLWYTTKEMILLQLTVHYMYVLSPALWGNLKVQRRHHQWHTSEWLLQQGLHKYIWLFNYQGTGSKSRICNEGGFVAVNLLFY